MPSIRLRVHIGRHVEAIGVREAGRREEGRRGGGRASWTSNPTYNVRQVVPGSGPLMER